MTRRERMARATMGASVLLVLAGLSGCAAGGAMTAAPAAAPVVIPPGAGPVTKPPPAPGRSCTASLPPMKPLPTVGHMPPGYLLTLQKRGHINVGVDQNTYRWAYRDGSGQLVGFDIDMLRQVAIALFGPAHLDKTLRFVVVPNTDRSAAVASGQVDIVAETMTITCARWKDVNFSSVYYEAGQRVLVPAGSPITSVPGGLAGRRVCAVAGSTSLDTLGRLPVTPPVIRWQATNQTDCLVLLQQGQVDAISTDDTILVGMAAQDPAVHLVPGAAFSREPYGMAIAKGNSQLTEFVNAVLEKVRISMWAHLYTKWIGPVPPPPPTPTYLSNVSQS